MESITSLIAVAFAGWSISSYATTAIYRLPRKEPLFDRRPFCSMCGNALHTADLFPIFSWLINRGKSRCCNAQLPATYLFAEISITVVFIVTYAYVGISEEFLLITLAATGAVMLAAIYYGSHGFFSNGILVGILFLGMLYRTIQDGSIYPAMTGGFILFVVAALIWKIQKMLYVGSDDNAPPEYVKLATAAGIWLL